MSEFASTMHFHAREVKAARHKFLWFNGEKHLYVLDRFRAFSDNGC